MRELTQDELAQATGGMGSEGMPMPLIPTFTSLPTSAWSSTSTSTSQSAPTPLDALLHLMGSRMRY